MKNIIEIKNLNFRYTSKHPVINDLNLTIKEESIYLFSDTMVLVKVHLLS